jgi:hypothetical protein
MWEPLRRFSALDRQARGLFLRAVAALPLVALSLRLRGFRATHESLQKLFPKSKPNGDSNSAATDEAAGESLGSVRRAADERVEMTARMVRAAAYRSFAGAGCLERSLTLWWLLGRQGIASSVRIGTRKTRDKLDAHAWVEWRGRVLNEPEDWHRHYAAFDEAFPVADQMAERTVGRAKK